jgi:enoyl-CoA hydratase
MAHVAIERRDGIALVRIDRPPANALDPDLVAELTAAGEELAGADPDAVVLAGSEKFFSAGLDLNVVPSLERDAQLNMIMGINRLVAAWYSVPRPVVCAVTGHAVAGGLIVALCADYRVGSTAGKLGLTEARVGVPFPAGAMMAVRAELEPRAARLLTLRAELVEAPAAFELGLLDELAEPGDVLERALVAARELAALPREAYATVKRQLRGDTLAALRGLLDSGTDPLAGSWLSDDTGAAASAALEKQEDEK